MRAEDNKQLVYFLVALNIIPHSVELPDWVIVAGLTFVLWKYASDHFAIPTPNKWIVHLLGLVCGLGVFSEFGTVMGDEASASVLVLAVALKLFEVQKYRDIMIVTILCYFLLMSKLISSQTIAITVFMLVDLVLITSLLALHHSPKDNGRATALIGRSFKLALISMPVVVSLFFVFPRFNIGIFKPNNRNVAEMGFSDELSPGSVSELLSSDKLIFRARFPNGDQLAPTQLYWRGAVLTEVDGLNWSKDPDQLELRHLDAVPKSGVIETEIQMEPTSSKHIFALDWPQAVTFPNDPRRRKINELSYGTFRAKWSFSTRGYYSVYSKTNSRNVQWNKPEISKFLKTSGQRSEKVDELLSNFKASNPKSSSEIVKAIYNYYQDNKFFYSLKSPRMKTVDDFLFEHRQGFCEHFAGVTAYLLREMGVPARVVVGFQGGKPSLLEDHLMVRALDAHAWLEYWDDEQSSWLRLDPTSVVAPLRLAGGAEDLIENLGGGQGSEGWINDFLGQELIRQFYVMQMVFDQVDASWTNFLLKYDFDYQKKLIEELGLRGSTRWVLAGFSALFLVIFMGMLMIFIGRQRTRGDRVSEIYWKFLKKAHKSGAEKKDTEGVIDFGERVVEMFPNQEEDIKDILTRVALYRYSKEQPSREDLKSLKKSVNEIQLQREN